MHLPHPEPSCAIFSLRLSVNDGLLLFNLCRYDNVCLLGSLFPGSTRKFGILFSLICFLHRLRSLDLLGSDRNSCSLGLLFTPDGIGIGNRYLGIVLTLDRLGIGIRSGNSGIADGFRNADILVPICLGLTDFTETVLLGDTLLGIVDRLGRSLLSESLDVA